MLIMSGSTSCVDYAYVFYWARKVVGPYAKENHQYKKIRDAIPSDTAYLFSYYSYNF